MVAAYVEQHPGADPSRKLALAAVRMLFDYLVRRRPAYESGGVREGATLLPQAQQDPVLDQDQARALIDSIDTSTIIGLRDRALLEGHGL